MTAFLRLFPLGTGFINHQTHYINTEPIQLDRPHNDDLMHVSLAMHTGTPLSEIATFGSL